MNDLNRLTLELQVVNSAIDHTHWNESFKEGKTLKLSEFSITIILSNIEDEAFYENS